MTTEGTLVTAMVKAIKRRHPHAWTFKVHGSPMQMAGVPDLLVCVDGLLIALEVKHQKPGESEQAARARTSRQQHYQITKINEAGGYAATVITVQEALEAIDNALEARNHA